MLLPQDTARLPAYWEAWVKKQLDNQVRVDRIIQLLVTSGFGSAFAIEQVRRIQRPLTTKPVEAPVFDASLNTQKIFVSVANYRDSETPHTIIDLLTQASYPDRVVFGVLSQVSLPTDEDCLVAEGPQVRQLIVRAEESRGACWARSRILSEMRRGEPYVLQIDSHTRAVPGWDEKALTMLKQCPTPRALLSCYPCGYSPPRQLTVPLICWCLPKRFNDHGVIELESLSCSYAERPASPVPTPFLGAGFLFGPAAAFDEVPYDPYLYFQGEEASLSLRLWTHGWNIFAPNDVLVYHDYTERKRHRHWDDHTDWGALNDRAGQRMRYLFGVEPNASAEALIGISLYGNGSARSVQQFEYYAGVNFARREIRDPRKTQFEWPPALYSS